MLVIPQNRNLRIGIVALSVLMFFLLAYVISNRLESNYKKNVLEQEKSLILNELSEMIDIYDAVEILNDSLKLQLKQSKAKIISTLDSVKQLEPDQTLISKLKSRMAQLRVENSQMLSRVNKIELENVALRKEKKEFEKVLRLRDSISELINSKYKHLVEENGSLKPDFNTLYVSNLNVKGAKRVTSKKRVVNTRYASRTKKFHVNFTVVKNKFLSKGLKTLYFQVLDSKMNVVANKGTVNFGRKLLTYSKKKNINYQGEEFEISAIIDKNEDEKLSKGMYFLFVVYNGEILAETSVILK